MLTSFGTASRDHSGAIEERSIVAGMALALIGAVTTVSGKVAACFSPLAGAL